jgi:hypothetical protein
MIKYILNFNLRNHLLLLILIIFLVSTTGCSKDPLGSYDDNGKPNKINFMIAKCFLNDPVDGSLRSCYGQDILSDDSNINIVNMSDYGPRTVIIRTWVRRGEWFSYTSSKPYKVNYTINPNGNVVALVEDDKYFFGKKIEFSRRADGYYARRLPLDCSLSERHMRDCEKQIEGPGGGFFKISIVRNRVAEESLNISRN